MNQTKPNAILLDPSDNVVTVTAAVASCDPVIFSRNGQMTQIIAAEAVPVFHKMAICDLSKGAAVIKYGEVIGKATMDIRTGAHVHIHNLSDE